MIKNKNKKGVMNQVVNIFILVLIISILSGMTFLFTSSLKSNVASQTRDITFAVVNETTGGINQTGYQLANVGNLSESFLVVSVYDVNGTGDKSFPSISNVKISSTGLLQNTTTETYGSNATISYNVSYISSNSAIPYLSVNTTEGAGYQTTSYLPLLFLALIFGAVLIVVLRIMLPYINLGNRMGNGGF